MKIELVGGAALRVGEGEVEPLRVAARAVVPVEQQVVLVGAHVDGAAQVASTKGIFSLY